MAGRAPNLDTIDARDLRDNDRLASLYREAVQRGYWPNSPAKALEFFAFAEKALHDDRQGTPGKLFYSLVKAKDGRRVTQAMEDRAMARMPSQARQELVEGTEGVLGRAPADNDELSEVLWDPDVGYLHAVFVQCFWPQRAPADRRYSMTHGRAALLVEAGSRIGPDGEWVECAVPSGAKTRLMVPYLVGQAVKTGSPVVSLGKSLRDFMGRVGVPITGPNGRALQREIANLAVASIVIGEWGEHERRQRQHKIANAVSFWVEPYPSQRSLWTKEMVLTPEFFDMVQAHRVPVHVGHLSKLGRSPRRMDLYAWLSYRTGIIPARRPATISLRAIWGLFGPDIAHFRNFKARLRRDLVAIAKVYPHFDVEIEGDLMRLRRSPRPVDFSAYQGRSRRLQKGPNPWDALEQFIP